jgi:hypothetical protein
MPPPDVLQLEKRGGGGRFFCKKLQHEYNFTHADSCDWVLRLLHTMPTPLVTWGRGWGSNFDLVILVNLSSSVTQFSHKESTYSLLQAGDRLGDLSQSPLAPGFHLAIIRVLWTELQCDTMLLSGICL